MLRLPLRFAAFSVLVALAAGCAAPGTMQADPPAAPSFADLPALPEDVHSYARPEEARVTHVALDLEADFDAKVLWGTATLTVASAPGASEIVLDTRGLTIEQVTDAGGVQISFDDGS